MLYGNKIKETFTTCKSTQSSITSNGNTACYDPGTYVNKTKYASNAQCVFSAGPNTVEGRFGTAPPWTMQPHATITKPCGGQSILIVNKPFTIPKFCDFKKNM